MINIMEHREQSARERAHQKELASKWHDGYTAAIEAFKQKEDKTIDDVVDLHWEHYLFARLVPEDVAEKQARKALRKEVWDGSRDDVELYIRILTSCYYADDIIDKNLTMGGGGFGSGAIFQSLGLLTLNFMEQIPMRHGRVDYRPYIEKYVERAKQEIVRCGGEVPSKRLRPGAIGEYKGMPVKVESLTGDGLVALEAADRNYENHGKLFDLVLEDYPESSGSSLPITALDLEKFENPIAVEQFKKVYTINPQPSEAWKHQRDIKRELEALNVPFGQLEDFSKVFWGAIRDREEAELQIEISYDKEEGFSVEVVE